MTKIVILCAVIGGFGGGSISKMGEYPSMSECMEAVTAAKITTREKVQTGIISREMVQTDWRPLRGDFTCVEAYK